MRLRGILPVALLVLALAGCASGGVADSGSPTSAPDVASASTPATGTASDARELVGTRWKRAGADTIVRFTVLAITVQEGDRSTGTFWTAQGDQVLIGGGTAPGAAPWLVATTTVHRDGIGWVLQDATGRTTARLVPDGTSDSAGSTALLGAGTPGPGVVDRPASALDGRWTLDGDARTSITFGDGEWHASSSCTSGAVGGVGVYRVLPGGRLLVLRTASPMRGCPVVDGPVTVGGTVISGIVRAASFRIDGDTLTLFDRGGARLGSLVRG